MNGLRWDMGPESPKFQAQVPPRISRQSTDHQASLGGQIDGLTKSLTNGNR